MGKKKKSKNKFISLGFMVLWIALIGVCLFVYKTNKTSADENYTKVEVILLF